MALGAALRRAHSNLIQRHGQLVTVTRLDGTTEQLYCIPQPLNTATDNDLYLEGTENLSEPNSYVFSFPGGSDVAEGMRVSYGGDNFRLTNANPPVEQGVATCVNVVGIRV